MLFKKWNSHEKSGDHCDSIDNPYARFLCTELILRDQLAIDRTILANERTFLAYCRTSLALVVTGAGFIKFFDTRTFELTGFALIAFSIIVMIFGIYRSASVSHRIKKAGVGMKLQRGQVHSGVIGKPDDAPDSGN